MTLWASNVNCNGAFELFETVNERTTAVAPGVVVGEVGAFADTLTKMRRSTRNVVSAPAPAPGVLFPSGELSIGGCATLPTLYVTVARLLTETPASVPAA